MRYTDDLKKRFVYNFANCIVPGSELRIYTHNTPTKSVFALSLFKDNVIYNLNCGKYTGDIKLSTTLLMPIIWEKYPKMTFAGNQYISVKSLVSDFHLNETLLISAIFKTIKSKVNRYSINNGMHFVAEKCITNYWTETAQQFVSPTVNSFDELIVQVDLRTEV